jgi:hypothetical protein
LIACAMRASSSTNKIRITVLRLHPVDALHEFSGYAQQVNKTCGSPQPNFFKRRTTILRFNQVLT